MADMFTEGFTPHQIKAQEIMEAQLKHTEEMIKHLREEHRHYTDDCGDYLTSALELSAALAASRTNGVEDLISYLNQLITEEEDGLLSDYASDGIAPEIYDFVTAGKSL